MKSSLSAVALLFILTQSPAWAGSEIVAGWEGSSARGYAFVSPVFGFPINERWSLVVRGAASYLYYEIPEGDTITQVRSPGQSLGFGLRYSAPRITATFGPGYEIRETRRSAESSRPRSETERGLTAQSDVFFQATPLTTLSALVSYGKANDYIWSRLGVKHQITNLDYSADRTLYIGAEVTSQGNEDVDSDQIGGLFEIGFPRSRASLQFRAGHARIRNPGGSSESEAYFGIGFYRGF